MIRTLKGYMSVYVVCVVRQVFKSALKEQGGTMCILFSYTRQHFD